MKISEEYEPFKPITITLESKGEALALYHLLNCPHVVAFKTHCEKEEWFEEIDNLDSIKEEYCKFYYKKYLS